MAAEARRKKPTAVFMAFGTKGDVYPVAAIAAAFASDQKQYEVAFVTHSEHENLKGHLGAKGVEYVPISSPPVLSSLQQKDLGGRLESCELFHVQCVVAAPYVVPYSAPSSFERQFRNELPHLYKYLREAPTGKDPVTGLPTWHVRPSSPLLLYLHGVLLFFSDPLLASTDRYGFSQEIVECPVTGHQQLGFVVFGHSLLNGSSLVPDHGLLEESPGIPSVLGNVLNITNHKFILFSAGYGPLDAAIKMFAQTLSSDSEQMQSSEIQSCLFDGRLFCFSGYGYLVKGVLTTDVGCCTLQLAISRCAAAIHHGGSGSTAAALRTGIPQVCSAIELVLISSVSIVAKLLNAIDCFRKPHSIGVLYAAEYVICPFILDQFYWAERMFWLGVAPEPLNSACLLPDKDDDTFISKAAHVLVGAINYALSPEVKLRAAQIADRISTEVECEVAEAAIYTVGGGGGWTFNVAAWPKGKPFKAGDTLGHCQSGMKIAINAM
ncbi:hypothetical protein DH2020_011195 [Rehmannia glutinosa]|uniref:Erythromycin biosynthesis protein CIII-like C-terminal domain-containing protein n=1 Tax=Rehmannia glutinosa TaxID=99300 RepID=A0ABR0XCN2_REHGL